MITFFLGISYHFSLLLKPQPSVDENILNALGFQSRISKSLTYISGTVANLCGGWLVYMVCLVLCLIYSMCAVFGPEVRVSLKVHSSDPEGLRTLWDGWLILSFHFYDNVTNICIIWIVWLTPLRQRAATWFRLPYSNLCLSASWHPVTI